MYVTYVAYTCSFVSSLIIESASLSYDNQAAKVFLLAYNYAKSLGTLGQGFIHEVL